MRKWKKNKGREKEKRKKRKEGRRGRNEGKIGERGQEKERKKVKKEKKNNRSTPFVISKKERVVMGCSIDRWGFIYKFSVPKYPGHCGLHAHYGG